MSAQPLDVFRVPLADTQLIEASAGTGKTWNICGLYLRLVLQASLQVQQILVVTFTNAATAELRERIRDRIAQVRTRLEGVEHGGTSSDPFVETLLATTRALGIDDASMKARLTQALRHFDEAAIFTIHGFSKRALDDAPFAARLPLVQELTADDGDLRHEVVNDFWRRNVAGADLAPELAAWLLQKKDSPDRLAGLLKRHAGKPLSRVKWPDGTESAPRVDATALRDAHAHARSIWPAARDKVVSCVMAALPGLHAGRYKEATIRKAAEQWDAVLRAPDAMATPPCEDKLALFTPGALKTKAKMTPCEKHPFFDAAQALLDAWKALEPDLERARFHLLRRMVDECPPALRELKRERRLIGYDDMLFNLHERLGTGDGTLAAALRQRFPAALIDEFQDTDPLQFAIFRGIYEGSGLPLFFVGDPKQAIYSFRNADLHTYLRARDIAREEYTLAENQRSTAALLHGLNGLFGVNPRAFMLDGLAYRPVTAGSKPRPAFADSTVPRGALQLWTLPTGEEGAPLSKNEARRAASQACAAEIARLLAAGLRGEVTLDGRPLAAGDIAVLVRSHAQGSVMRQALMALGVGSVELSQASVFQSPDAEEVERILLAVLHPARESLLRAALATEIMGLDAVAIAALDERAMLARIERFGEHLATWTNRGIGPMLRELWVDEGVEQRMLERADGERRLTNLRHLGELLNEAAQTHPGPETLLRWLQRQRREDAGGEEVNQLRLESDRNLVQIVTVHKSKGLEYPVVFCPMLWDGHPGRAAEGLGREYHDADGTPVVDYRDPPDDEKADIKARMALERDAERVRLIYVALTRAVHRCYLVVGAYAVKAGRGMSTAECTRNPLNWLVAGAGLLPGQWSESKLEAADVVAAWEALARANAPEVALSALPEEAGVALPPAPGDEESALAVVLPATLAPGWRIASYSSLAHAARSERAAVDHDARVERAARSGAVPEAVADDDILRFPRGARAGETLHAVFERADFADAASWPAAVDAALRARPPEAAARDAQQGAMALRMLGDVLATPLPGGFRLSDVKPAKRLIELEFSLSAGGLAPQRLVAALQRHGYAPPSVSAGVLHGYLRGFIDLVFEHEGRFHILDWKSNHLGHDARAYSAERLMGAMNEQGYHLQYLLYTVALHRWLRQRHAAYDYERHFGGVYYLFVRGVRPAWGAAGVFFHKPSLEVVEQLDALLDGGRG
ncbi:exodeoxyribonuclease V subunit beta [Ramlibacter sp.]|uniref:exodeoxyribonuclease V subunit beta n=1 Tax=Ramlibacter sp. TaxID=1917967 RepID=UPI003D0C3A0E